MDQPIIKRKRGRPRKHPLPPASPDQSSRSSEPAPSPRTDVDAFNVFKVKADDYLATNQPLGVRAHGTCAASALRHAKGQARTKLREILRELDNDLSQFDDLVPTSTAVAELGA